MNPKRKPTSGKTDSELKELGTRVTCWAGKMVEAVKHQPCSMRMEILLASTHVTVGPVGQTNHLKS